MQSVQHLQGVREGGREGGREDVRGPALSACCLPALVDSKILIEVVKCNVLFTVSLLSGIFQSFTDLRCSSDHDDSLHYCSLGPHSQRPL